MKFLFVGGGRRNQLSVLLNERGVKVDSYELDINCPILINCNKVIQGRKWSDDKIKEDLFQLSKSYDLIIPLMDEATKLLSELNLSNACVSDFETANICLNKKFFEEFFISDNELKKYYPSVDDTEDIVVKPIFGFSSSGILFTTKTSLSCIDNKDCIIQKRIFGDEYSVDCFYSIDSVLIDFVPRKRIKVIGGEVVESKTICKKKFLDIVNLISSKIKFKGPICMQFIEDKEGNLWIMEINARLGGGSTLSIASGFDMLELMITCFCKKNFNFSNYRSNYKQNFYLKRFFMDYCYEKK